MSTTRHYSLHGVPIIVHARASHLERAVHALLHPIAVECPPAAGGDAGMPGGIILRLLSATSGIPVPPPTARCWMAVDMLRLLTDERDVYLLLDDRLVGIYSPGARRITAWIPPALADHPDVIGQMVVLPLLLEALRARLRLAACRRPRPSWARRALSGGKRRGQDHAHAGAFARRLSAPLG